MLEPEIPVSLMDSLKAGLAMLLVSHDPTPWQVESMQSIG